ncbi:Pyridoxal-phosphate dependent enzyme [Jiangella sp. DSM 45060]|nr:Pyridoxal-phosphate dependent enzyme [Jiangella sp. DSM 45060]
MAAAVATARASSSTTVIAASSGNAGASAAAYAARAGLRCIVVTTSSLPPVIHAQILAAGAGGHPYAVEGLKSVAYEVARDLGDTLGAVVVPTSRADLLAGTGSDVANWQGLQALWNSGSAAAVDEADFLAEQRRAAAQGLFLEASSAVALAAARRLPSDGAVVAIGTASGIKDIDLVLREAPPLHVIGESLAELRDLVRSSPSWANAGGKGG